MIRHLRRVEEQVIVKPPGKPSLTVPAWMLDPEFCSRLITEPVPRIAIAALLNLRRLIDDHDLPSTSRDRDYAESPSGGPDARSDKRTTTARVKVRRRAIVDDAPGTSSAGVSLPVAADTRNGSHPPRSEAK
ncbi:MAG: hypothetical protein JO182_26620 [Acidobacteriaceae bacterium]|nr:hypothetical protein [Acidobacteriaceae bacterium]MBV9222636.1 hypothetical protein [Acidobacteriaceae bacterium]MBV9305900.1 hypothetical protein [Acidobacteriaceae bacterium]MBV9677298.1 hypothetical protein [Acidobacteriaceae bacterium]MBV9937553.1 hypothetical protein [Acidobacteriaceae bacterium]